jgi:hypothetical protein
VLGRDPVPEDGPRAIGGSVERLRDTFGRYAAAGVDEFIVPSVVLGSAESDRGSTDVRDQDPQQSRELYDLLADEVAPGVAAGPQPASGVLHGP